jgi:hypothetical protein
MFFTFGPQPAVDVTTGLLVHQEGLSGRVYASRGEAEAETNPLEVTIAGVVTTNISVSAIGQTQEFTPTTEDIYQVWWSPGGGVVAHLFSFDGAIELIEGARADVAASAAAAQAAIEDAVFRVNDIAPINGNVTLPWSGGGGEGGGGGDVTWATLPGRPDTYPPAPHNHGAGDIVDATSLGRNILRAGTPQQVREYIGAGTGNGTSNLQLGTSGTTAAPGNHTHPQYVDQAQAASIADERIALSGGGGGSGAVLVWRYRSGAYPALPTAKPAGVELILARGPIQPSSLPSWAGNGADQVPVDYLYNGGLS